MCGAVLSVVGDTLGVRVGRVEGVPPMAGRDEWGEEPLEIARMRESGAMGDLRPPGGPDWGGAWVFLARTACLVVALGIVLAIAATGNWWLLVVLVPVLCIATWGVSGWRQFFSRDHDHR